MLVTGYCCTENEEAGLVGVKQFIGSWPLLRQTAHDHLARGACRRVTARDPPRPPWGRGEHEHYAFAPFAESGEADRCASA